MVYSKKIYRFNMGTVRNISYLLYVLLIIVSVPQAAFGTEPLKNMQSSGKKEQIHITSDLLTTLNETGVAEFSGNVRAVQGDTVITSDRLRIYYRDTADKAEKLSGGFGAVEKIVASGQVNIKFEGKQAFSDEAVYYTDTQVLTLSGPNSKVINNDDSISGAQITLYRSDGRIKVESNDEKRVEAIFYHAETIKGD